MGNQTIPEAPQGAKVGESSDGSDDEGERKQPYQVHSDGKGNTFFVINSKPSEERIKKHEGTKVDVPNFPNQMQWKNYGTKLTSQVCQCSAYGDDKERTWLKPAFNHKTDLDDLQKGSKEDDWFE